MEGNYYFISYTWKNKDGDVFFENDVIDTYPLNWLLECQVYQERYRLSWWIEISKKTYNQYDEKF